MYGIHNSFSSCIFCNPISFVSTKTSHACFSQCPSEKERTERFEYVVRTSRQHANQYSIKKTQQL